MYVFAKCIHNEYIIPFFFNRTLVLQFLLATSPRDDAHVVSNISKVGKDCCAKLLNFPLALICR